MSVRAPICKQGERPPGKRFTEESSELPPLGRSILQAPAIFATGKHGGSTADSVFWESRQKHTSKETLKETTLINSDGVTRELCGAQTAGSLSAAEGRVVFTRRALSPEQKLAVTAVTVLIFSYVVKIVPGSVSQDFGALDGLMSERIV